MDPGDRGRGSTARTGPGPCERRTLGGREFPPALRRFPGRTLPERSGFVSYHFMDVDGDGLVDLLTNVWTRGSVESRRWSKAEAIGGDFAPLSTFTRSRTTTRPRPATSRTSARTGHRFSGALFRRLHPYLRAPGREGAGRAGRLSGRLLQQQQLWRRR